MSFEGGNLQKVKLGGCKMGKFFISDKCREPRLYFRYEFGTSRNNMFQGECYLVNNGSFENSKTNFFWT